MNYQQSSVFIAFKQASAVIAVLLSFLLICLSGCGGGFPSHSVDASKARDALKTTLERWKNGDAIDSLKSGSPTITAQDLDWLSGATLVSYEVAGEGGEMDANLKIPVRLTLKTKGGKEVKKSVSYLVTTSPEITVFRDFQ